RSTPLQIESLEARSVPSALAGVPRSPALADWQPPGVQVREMLRGGATGGVADLSALHSISPFGGGTRVGPGSANGNRIISVNWEPNRSSGEEIPQQIVPFGGVKVDPGSANGKQISPLGGGIKVDPGSDNGHQVVSILDGIRVGSDDANGD